MNNDYSTELNNWWKSQYGTDWDGSSKPSMSEGMTTHDYNRGVTLYGDYVARKNIGSNYDYAVGMANAAYDRTASAAEKARRQEMEYAGVLYERMKKYLPHQQKMAGMGNMGVAQTGLNRLTNTHMNRRGAIQGEYNDTMADADYTRAMAIGAAEQARATALSERDGLTAQQMADIYTAEESAQTSAINAFKTNIFSYTTPEAAEADLATLGLSETDPKYIALKKMVEDHFANKAESDAWNTLNNMLNKNAWSAKEALTWLGHANVSKDTQSEMLTLIQDHFRDLGETKTQQRVDTVMANLENGVYQNAEDAKKALKDAGGTYHSAYENNLAVIESWFTNKTNDDLSQVYSDIMAILTSEGSYEEKAQMMSQYQEYIPQFTEHQQKTINYLYGTDASRSMKAAVGALMDDYATDDEIKAELEKWKDAPGYQDYYDEVMKEIDTDKFNYYQYNAANGDGFDYVDELLISQLAENEDADDVDTYKEEVINGDRPIEVKAGTHYTGESLAGKKVKITSEALPSDHPFFESTLINIDLKNAETGTVTPVNSGRKVQLMVKFNGKWYRCKVID